MKEGKLDDLLEDVKPGDFVLMQFGDNDATVSRPNRYVAPADFEKWLQLYVDGAKQRGAVPVLVTPPARYSYDADGNFKEDFKSYGDVMRNMAANRNIPLIDLSEASIALCDSMGAEGAESLFLHMAAGEYEGAYASGVTDNTHLQYYGAYKFAQCVAKELKNMVMDGFDATTKSRIRDLQSRVVLTVPTAMPAQATGLHASSVGASSVTLKWDKAEGAEIYYVYRAELKNGETAGSVNFSSAKKYATATGEQFTDKKCAEGATYVYAVAGYNDKGLGALSDPIEAATKSATYHYDFNYNDSPTMDGWTGVKQDQLYTASAGYGWITAPNNGRYRKNNGNAASSAMADDFCLGAGEFAIDLPDGDYEIKIYAGDLLSGTSTIKTNYTAEGESIGSISVKQNIGTLSASVRVTDGQLDITTSGTLPYINGLEITPVLPAPSGLTYSEYSVQGDRATFLIGFNPIDEAVSYNVYGKISTDSAYQLLKSFTKEEYENDELDARSMTAELGDTYQYYLTGVTESGTETAPSNVLEVEALNPSVPKPDTPQNVSTQSVQNAEITIAWDPVATAERYVIYRSDKSDSGFEKAGESTSASYTDRDNRILAGHAYYYKVQAKNRGGSSDLSADCETPVAEGSPVVIKKAETLTDRAAVAINLAGAAGGETVVSATDKSGNEYTKGIYLSWRSFEADPKNVTFDVYRSGRRIAKQITATNLVDVGGTEGDVYRVVGSSDKKLGLQSPKIKVWANKYLELSLNKPANQTMPDGSICTYTANDMSVGDLDGDGRLELIVKWYPSNAKDNSQSGYTGTTFLDGYNVDFSTGQASLLWRINMGVNIRSGAHYTQFLVWDFDGDGKAEIGVKTADGTTIYRNTGSGLEETGYIGACNADALPADKVSAKNDYRNSSGYVLTGPEYYTMFNGEDGTVVSTTSAPPAMNRRAGQFQAGGIPMGTAWTVFSRPSHIWTVKPLMPSPRVVITREPSWPPTIWRTRTVTESATVSEPTGNSTRKKWRTEANMRDRASTT